MTSTSSLESKPGVSAEVMSDDRLHRGRNVALSVSFSRFSDPRIAR